MNAFLISLPAILGIFAFVIYQILRKSVIEDPVIKSILGKINFKDSGLYQNFDGLTKVQKEDLIKNDQHFRQLLSQRELDLLDSAMRRQFQTNIFVYSLSGVLVIIGVILFINQSNKPKSLFVDNIQVQNTNTQARSIAVDLDPLTVTWTSTGQDEEVFVALENAETGQQSKKVRVQASEGKVTFTSNRYDNYDKILSNRQPLEVNRIRAIIFAAKEAFKSKEFELKVGVRLYCLATLPNKIDFFATIDNVTIENYHFLPKLALFEDGSFSNKTLLEGEQLAPQHSFIVQHPKKIDPKNYILTYSNPVDDRIVRTEVDLSEFYKLKKK